MNNAKKTIPRIACVGEVLVDIKEGSGYPGGASLNLAAHAQRMGSDVHLVTSLGKDARGEKLAKFINQQGIDDSLISFSEYPTGWVDVTVDNGMPSYQIHENVAWDHIQWSDEQYRYFVMREWDVIVIGTLVQRSAHNFTFLKRVLKEAKTQDVFFDLNLRQQYYSLDKIEWGLRKASILKLNDEEAMFLSKELLAVQKGDFDAIIRSLMEAYDLSIVLLTLGADGALICDGEGVIHVPSIPVTVEDTIGAGDSFSACFLHHYISGYDIRYSAEKAAILSGFVASQSGPIPDYSLEIKKQMGLI